MIIPIFVNNGVILFSNYPIIKNNYYHISHININYIINELWNYKKKIINIYHKNIKKIWFLIFKNYKIIRSSGGIIFDKKEEYILFIYRNNKWDFPKGKIEKNETSKKAAIREIIEECGIIKKNIKIIKKINNIYYLYKNKKNYILKDVIWYKMIMKNKFNKFIPQKEENIEKICWIYKKNIKKIFKKTYPSIKFILYFITNKKNFITNKKN
ncbi:NUDIX domain-containing protein [Candidatus Shikimatogenerans silvanidophilus]|uniref:NUDIX domain-containing protein n=1 Tax=Candidatus Shikimatogenerans silvanidophilus TaxID=2782547 RepID=UPI001BA71319|nr:NUDIX domain-containing protein [Candidatus Shikimatogenerans silvanidophilus]